MKSFIAACVFALAVAVIVPYALPVIGQNPGATSMESFKTGGVRLDDPGHNLIGK